MAQYQITVDQEILQQLFLGNSKDASVAKLLESVLNQVLKAQVSEQVAADHYERTLESDILCKKGAAHLYERLPRSPKNCVGLNSLNPLFPAYANGSIPLLSQGEKLKGAVGL